SNGVSIVVGQFLGAGKNKDSKLILAQGVFFNFCLGLLLMVIFFFGNGALLKMANTKDSAFLFLNHSIKRFHQNKELNGICLIPNS
ncbi:MAG: hypothetical protein II508_00800, partial [Acholeplasmatales bacterium]|nr:hypothetical protein [Acholeplasmatales bacterium]